MSSSSRHVPLILCALGTLAEVASATVEPPVGEKFMLCTVYDHEIFDNVIAWQEPSDTSSMEAIQTSEQKLRMNRLKPSAPLNPTDATDVFQYALPGPDYDTGLVPLAQSANGPEIGHDQDKGYEVVYTKRVPGAPSRWNHARQANDHLFQIPLRWERVNFVNDVTWTNRWRPFVTQNTDTPARVVYFRTGDDRAFQRGLVFRTLEQGVPDPLPVPPNVNINPADETAILPGDPNASSWGHWVRIDNKDYVVTTHGVEGSGNVQVVLYDVVVAPNTPIFLTNLPGERTNGFIDFDPAADDGAGRYTLANAKTVVVPGTPPTVQTSVEVWQRTAPTVWALQYEFTSAHIDPLIAANYPHVQSPEVFQYSGRLYIVFVVDDNVGPEDPTRGNILITRVEADDTTPGDNHYRQLNAVDAPPDFRKRTEPEVVS